MQDTPSAGDEEGFLNYEEKVVHDLQKAWSTKPGMEGCAVVNICEQLDNLIYSDTLKEFSLSTTANVWSKREYITFYQSRCDQLIRNLESKELNWKKLFDESRMNARHVLQTIMKGDNEKKSRGSDAYKAASRALMPKARKSAIGFSVASETGKRKSVGKPRGPKSVKFAKDGLGMSNSSSFGAYMDSGASAEYSGQEAGGDSSHGADAGLLLEAGLDDFGFDFSEEQQGEGVLGGGESWME
jgi:hypothetical protein